MTIVDFNQFDGQDNVDAVANSALFGLSYASIFSIPKPSSQQLPNPDVGYSNLIPSTRETSSNAIPSLALHYNYDRLKPNAIDDNILFISNEQPIKFKNILYLPKNKCLL